MWNVCGCWSCGEANNLFFLFKFQCVTLLIRSGKQARLVVDDLWIIISVLAAHSLSTCIPDVCTHGLVSRQRALFSQYPQQLFPVLAQLAISFAHIADGSASMQHRCMVAPPERIADFRQTVFGQFLGERHRHLPRPRNRTTALFRQKICLLYTSP